SRPDGPPPRYTRFPYTTLFRSEEGEAVLAAILLHDIGHGPFSHSLEHSLITGVSHELLSSLLMDRINQDLGGRLSLAINIFNNRSEEHTSELQSRENLVCRLLL